MKIEFNQALLSYDGKSIKDGEKDLTLATCAVVALMQNYADEQGLGADAKVKRYSLIKKISAETEGGTDLPVEDIAIVKSLIGKFFSVTVVGPAFEALEGKPTAVASIGKASKAKP